ncbi:MAG: galactose-1-epimerase, partial [Oscillospiraceae bacterium]|nr:galactose-1-epimerase [Oscillospiraceae bacterium]
MKITVSAYGVTEDGQSVERYVLENSRRIRVSVITFGAIITHLTVPDRTGAPVDIVLGYDSLADYERDDCYFGACIG